MVYYNSSIVYYGMVYYTYSIVYSGIVYFNYSIVYYSMVYYSMVDYKRKDPTNHGFWNPPGLGPQDQDVSSVGVPTEAPGVSPTALLLGGLKVRWSFPKPWEDPTNGSTQKCSAIYTIGVLESRIRGSIPYLYKYIPYYTIL